MTAIDCPDYNGVAFDMDNYESSQGWLFTYRIHMSGCLHIEHPVYQCAKVYCSV